jgi:hypothetical protein
MLLRHRFLPALALLLLVPAAVRAQIPNPGFENWTSGSPDNWATSNVVPVVVPVTQSSTAHTGSSAARGTVVSFYTSTLAPILQSGPGARGFGCTSRPTSLRGYYQFHSVGGDKFATNTILYKGVVAGTVIGNAASANASEVTSWTQFSVPFNYVSSANPDTCIIQIQIVGPVTGSDYHVGSYFLLDDLSFGGVTGVDGPPASASTATAFLESAPNPFASRTTVAFTLARFSSVTLQVLDLQGRVVATLLDGPLDAGQHQASWDASRHPSGLYWCRLTAGGVTLSRRLVCMR